MAAANSKYLYKINKNIEFHKNFYFQKYHKNLAPFLVELYSPIINLKFR